MALSPLQKLLGRTLHEDLIDDYGAVVIPKDTVVTREWIDRASSHPISCVPVVRDVQITKSVDQTMSVMDRLFFRTRQAAGLELNTIREFLVPAVQNLSVALDIQNLLLALRKDHYTVQHSLAVAVMSTMLGRWLKLSDRDIDSLSMAAVLHDIGKSKIPEPILNKPDRLTAEEYEIMKKHTIYGYQILSKTVGISPRQALVALQHHERVDGSGYPLGLTGEQIEPFARIVAIVDVFHAMTSKRVYKDAVPLYHVLSELNDGQYGSFDPAILHVFIRRIMENLLGTEVQLSSGETGIVVLLNDTEPLRPLVQVESRFIDLSKVRSINIVDFVPDAQINREE